MSYPNAYCVKCGTHTDTLQKHTVVFQNKARAVKGVCAQCASEVYKIVPKAKDFRDVKAIELAKTLILAPALPAKSERRVASARHAESVYPNHWSFVAAAGAIFAIIFAFFAYAVI